LVCLILASSQESRHLSLLIFFLSISHSILKGLLCCSQPSTYNCCWENWQ
jgi:hypothetical protein